MELIGLLLSFLGASSYRILKYFKYDYLINENIFNRVIYHIIVALMVFIGFSIFDNWESIITPLFFTFAVVSSLELMILFPKKD